MRAIFGLGAVLLMLVAMVIFLAAPGGYLDYNKAVIQQGKIAKAQVSQLAGIDPSGRPVGDSITLVPTLVNGQFRSLRASYVLPRGAMAVYYGLRTDDEIIRVGDIGVRDNNDPELAQALVLEAYQRQWPVHVVRDGRDLVLPRDREPDPAAPPGLLTPQAPAGPSSPAPAPAGSIPGLPNLPTDSR